jgi:hypothetical protein
MQKSLVAAETSTSSTTAEDPTRMNSIAESYVKLVLAVGQHDANYVDAFYGPAEWKQAAEAAGKRPLAELRAEARSLLDKLGSLPPAAEAPTAKAAAATAAGATPGNAAHANRAAAGHESDDSETELLRLRHRYLERQLSAVAAHVEQLAGARMSFDEES